MTEFVYALHDFTPEHDDEIAFKAGERIQVIEKDDLYSDGWWQGCNLEGKVGLFPQAYTSASAPAPPPPPAPEVRTPTTLHPLQEEVSEDPVPSEPPQTSAPAPTNDTVMAATLTDVQEAIEQLAVRRDQDTDAGRSFSFASSRDADTETDDDPGDDRDGQGWHKDARKALAERAEKENAKKLREDETNGFASPHKKSQSTPPIAVELSDESDADDEDEEVLRRRHDDIHPHHHKYSTSTSTALPPEISLNDPPEPSTLQPAITLTDRTLQSSLPTPPSPTSPQEPRNEVTILDSLTFAHPTPQTPTTATTPRFHPSIAPPSHIANITGSLPSPATSSTGGATLAMSVPLPKSPAPRIMNGNSSSATPRLDTIEQTVVPTIPHTNQQLETTVPADPITPPQSSNPPATESIHDSLVRAHPSEWTVEQVVEWLKSKNVDETTCARFVEHEITGDVLLELDINILKEELNITAFGKRMRIANGIIELRRPASFSSDPTGFQNSFTGATSPQAADWSVNGHRQEVSSNTSGDARSPGFVQTPGTQKHRPAQLSLSSPSDGALNTKAPGGSETFIHEADEDEAVAHRGVQSDTETAAALVATKRRQFLGRSTDSGSSSRGDKEKEKGYRGASRKSNEVTTPLSSIPNSPSLSGDKTSPATDDAMASTLSVGMNLRPQHMKGKRSIDGPKGSDRLSFFSTTLGMSRKPPPRYENDVSRTQATPERSTRSIARYLGSSSKKNGRPGTASREETKVSSEVTRDGTILRKRKFSTVTSVATAPKPATVTPLQPAAKVTLKPGQSVLDQIGRPDHAGWLRKKGVRYNTWKLRYLVLKGPHLYYLRSNGRSETKIKGYIKVQGYKVIADENANPGKYGFRIVHDSEPPHFFSSEEQMVVREWMKALMKATIDRDFSKPVVSSCNIPTIPLAVAQAMNPAPRPPSPSARAATQKALRRENPNQLSSRDARILMGVAAPENHIPPQNVDRGRLESFFTFDPVENAEETHIPTPPRPSRDMRNLNNRGDVDRVDPASEIELVDWANSVLPDQYRIRDLRTDLSSGLVLLRLAETVGGKQNEPPVPDSTFDGDNLEGMFKLFDFLLDHDVKIGNVSINDIKQGRPDKTAQLLKAIKGMGKKR